MTQLKAASHAGFTLVYDTEDVERCSVSTPHDVYDVTPDGASASVLELGQAHLVLRVDFKPGRRPMWVADPEEASA